jgi:hypothetical protein
VHRHACRHRHQPPEIDAMIHEGETGKIMEMEDEAEHKTIEVWLE